MGPHRQCHHKGGNVEVNVPKSQTLTGGNAAINTAATCCEWSSGEIRGEMRRGGGGERHLNKNGIRGARQWGKVGPSQQSTTMAQTK